MERNKTFYRHLQWPRNLEALTAALATLLYPIQNASLFIIACVGFTRTLRYAILANGRCWQCAWTNYKILGLRHFQGRSTKARERLL